jgi:3-oxoacyl-[acyl-carrier protein] reductase
MKNKCVLVLGGSSDIGIELIRKYLSQNWKVICHYNKSETGLNKLKQNHRNQLTTVKADFASENSIKKFTKIISKKNIHSMINLVGYLDNVSFKNTNLKSLLKSLQINSIAPLLIQKYVIKNMIKKKFGRILHASSIGVKYGGSEYTFNYSYSKHALEYIPSYIKNLTQFNILSNTIRIGVVNTKLLKKVKKKNINKRVKLIPIKRFATRKEISDMIFFLGSEKNTYISGENVSISGGE